MDDLVQWLGAQLDEDERIARAATPGPWRVQGDGVIGADGHWPVAYTDSHRSDGDCNHVSAHDPARVLREIDAKRRIIRLYSDSLRLRAALRARMRELADSDRDEFGRLHRQESELIEETERLRPVVQLLALPYSDRPGYREVWRT